MKVNIAIALLVVSVAAEPPIAHRLSARQQTPPASAPYAPSGWRPQGASLTLPRSQKQREDITPPTVYGPPIVEIDNTNSSSKNQRPSKVSANADNHKSSAIKEQRNTYFLVAPRTAPLVAAEVQKPNLVYIYSGVQKSALLQDARIQQAAVVAPYLTVQSVPAYEYVYTPVEAQYFVN
ncbi:hypothetical protein FQA39_LY04166 [Lamprigera yunnana]|nr:hypothetical protein FQA39_LY04166 [Lamprigera yunnana]